MLTPALADALRSGRSAFNTRFATARRRWPQLDAADFSLFLRDQLSPLFAAVATHNPAQASTVANVGYDLGLQLVAEKLAGPAATDRGINQLWESVFPQFAPLVAGSPRRVLGSLCNAAHRLATTAGADAAGWQEQLATLGPRCADAGQLLALAHLLAWRAGLAAYRASAFAAAGVLPAPLALAAVRAPADATWADVAAAHALDPWFGYDLDGRPIPPSKAVRRVGTFRGFGGLFPVPPTVSAHGGHLVVRSGDEAWGLIADVHGATFHRTSAEPAAKSGVAREHASLAAHLPSGHTLASVAVVGSTFALTAAQSHAVWVGPLAAR